MPKPIAFTTEKEKSKQIIDFYQKYMEEQKAKAQYFTSADDFKKSALYQEMSEEEREQYKDIPPNATVLVFEDADQAREFVEQMQQKKLISDDVAEEILSTLDEESQYRPHM